MINTFTGMDHSCSNVWIVNAEILLVDSFYRHNITKWYWNGINWTLINYIYGYTTSADSEADYATDYTKNPNGSPQILYPNGCSDLPSKQPDQIPNHDTGNPECPSEFIN